MPLVGSSRLRNASSAGFSTLELVISMSLMSLVSAVVLSALSTSSRATAQIDDHTRGLAGSTIVTEWLSRDLREARSIDAGARASELSVWIDGNADYRRQVDEVVTWRISCAADVLCSDVDGHYQALRVRDGTEQLVGDSLVSDQAFTYALGGRLLLEPTLFDTADSVRVSMEYDTVMGAYAGSDHIEFEIRLRNAE